MSPESSASSATLRDALQQTVAGTYRIDGQLDGGGMSTVFLARELALDRPVVIKVLPVELATADAIARFKREIAILATLTHPHIVPVLAAGDVQGMPYYVMPYVEGKSLRARLARGPLAVRETLSILVDVGRALAFAHERGIIHRDIKPDNILLTAHSAVVSDFGVAKARARARHPNTPAPLTSEGVSLGTPAYMAPEQVAGDNEVDARTDLYALGIVAYEMLAGAPPFTGSTSRKLMTAHLTETPRPIAGHRSDVPAAVVHLVMRCLAKDPTNRPRSAMEVVRALQDPSVTGSRTSAGSLAEAKASIRSLLRAPGVTLYALLCLALGTGATLAVFAAIDRALIEPLPFAHASELVTVYRTSPQLQGLPLSAPTYVDLARTVVRLHDLAAMDRGVAVLSLPNDATTATVLRVSGNLFSALGVRALHGRLLDSTDVARGAPVALISEELWRAQFGADTTLIGRSIQLNGVATEVVGILPGALRIPHGEAQLVADVWIPLQFTAAELARRGTNYLYLLGRLAPGATPRDAERELVARMAEIGRRFPELRDESFRVVPLQSDGVAAIRAPLALLFGAVCMVLLVATGNVVCLLLARGVHRQREFAVRSALGASAWDIVRPVLAETLALSLAGVAIGGSIAVIGIRVVSVHLGDDLPQLANLSVSVRLIPFALLLSIIVACLAGALPAWRGARVAPHDVLHGGRGDGARREQNRALTGLVVAEVALSLVLVIGAGLVAKAFAGLLHRDPGFDSARMLTLDAAVAPVDYANKTMVRRFLAPALAAIEQVPGVDAVGAISVLPYGRCCNDSNIRYEGMPPDIPSRLPLVENRVVTPGFFRVTRQRLIAGRLLRDADGEPDAFPVVVANEAVARRDFPGHDAVGKRYYMNDTTLATIVGVVSSISNVGPIRPPQPEFYSLYQPDGGNPTGFSLVVRVRRGDPARLSSAVTAAIRSVDRRAAVTRVKPMSDVIADSVRRQRFFLSLIGAFASIAVLLSLAGLHRVLSYAVARRTRELGIRAALGRAELRTVASVLRGGIALIGAGVTCGLLCSALLTRLLQSILYGVSPLDTTTWIVATLGLTAAGMVAIVLPSFRAARIDPMTAMRTE